MKETTLKSRSCPCWLHFIIERGVLIFSIVTVASTFAIALLPLPMLATPMLIVLIPTLVAIGLVSLTSGFKQIRNELFRPVQWRFSLSWKFILLGLYLAQGLVSFGVATVLGIPIQFGLPPLSPLYLLIFFFAAREEIGWRGYVLPRLLQSHSPLAASLLLGIPWAVLHYALMLPGEILADTQPLAHFLFIISISVLLTWTYLRSNRNLLAVTFLHGWINALSILVVDVPTALIGLSTAAWAGLALLTLILTKGKLEYKDDQSKNGRNSGTFHIDLILRQTCNTDLEKKLAVADAG
jgi:membrane protease YdiL (CAAX protease family)